MISVGRILFLRQPVAERSVGDKVFVERLEETGSFQTQRIGDLLLEGLAERDPRHACKRQLCQGDAAAGVHELLAVRTDPSEPRRDALSVQHVLQREQFVVCRIAREAVQVVARSVAEQGGKGHRALLDEFRHHARDIRVKVDKSLVCIPQEGQREHGFADRSRLE